MGGCTDSSYISLPSFIIACEKNHQVLYLPVNSLLDMAVGGIVDDSSSVEDVEIIKIIFCFFLLQKKEKGEYITSVFYI